MKLAGKKDGLWSLAIVLSEYIGISLWLIMASNGLPFGIRNDESFGFFIHSRNLFQFNFFRSSGLTDESYSPVAAAHPFVYTHAGNFQRFFTWLMYALGARSVESQIVVFTFTIGLISVILTHRFFSKVTNSLFSGLVCTLLITNYLMYEQWQFDTFRGWWGFCFFASLLLVHGWQKFGNRKAFQALFILNFALIAYGELAWALYLNVVSAVYAALIYKSSRRTLFKIWSLQVVGSCLSVGILLGQLSAYMGFKNALKDGYYTFIARDFYSNTLGLEQLYKFYSEHNVLFLHAIFHGNGYLNFGDFVRSFLVYNFQVYTPAWYIVIFTFVLGWIFASKKDSLKVPAFLRPFENWLPALALGGLFLFIFSLVGSAIIGMKAPFDAKIATVAAIALGFCMWKVAPKNLPKTTLLPVTAFLFLISFLILTQYKAFHQDHAPFWTFVSETWGSIWLFRFVTLSAVGISVHVIHKGIGEFLSPEHQAQLKNLRPFFISSFAGYAATYLVFPAFIHYNYLNVCLPLAIFGLSPLLALPFYILFFYVRRMILGLKQNAKLLSSLAVLSAIVVLVFGATYWLKLQWEYLKLFPIDYYGFLTKLEQPPFHGAGIISNEYPAPVAIKSGRWAYYDWTMTRRSFEIDENGYKSEMPYDQIWAADAKSNPEYLYPPYFVYILYKDFNWIFHLYDFENGQLLNKDGGASMQGIVKKALAGGTGFPRDEVVDIDKSPFDHWAIVKLDWDFPPILKPLGKSNHVWSVGMQPIGEKKTVEVIRIKTNQETLSKEKSSVPLQESLTGASLFVTLRMCENCDNVEITADGQKTTLDLFSKSMDYKNVVFNNPGDHVRLLVKNAKQGRIAEVEYSYFQQRQAPEGKSLVRIYSIAANGERSLLVESRGSKTIKLPAGNYRRILASVIPISETQNSEFEYFSLPVAVK